jgi:hypothetical protein
MQSHTKETIAASLAHTAQSPPGRATGTKSTLETSRAREDGNKDGNVVVYRTTNT